MYAEDRCTITDRREMLRVKLKSLAAESKIIRQETERLQGCKNREVKYTDHRGIERVRRVAYGGRWGSLQQELLIHRRSIVRSEARCTLLAYGFIRGRTLEQMEGKSTCPPNWDKVRAMLKKYGPVGMLEPEQMKQAA